MSNEQEDIKHRLDEELSCLSFSGQQRVLQQTHPTAPLARLRALWNKELEIPLKPLGALSALLVAGALILCNPQSGNPEHEARTLPVQGQRELIEAGGNTYWKDIYEQAVRSHEN
jgi:hypothetical protein